eukprot:366069-Chlamydomonas_euryale.AAC.6
MWLADCEGQITCNWPLLLARHSRACWCSAHVMPCDNSATASYYAHSVPVQHIYYEKSQVGMPGGPCA